MKIIQGDAAAALRTMPDESVNCVVTSPPYWGLRDYGVDGQIGLESTPEEYVERTVEVFREVRRVLRRDGTLWLNLGDKYADSSTSPRLSSPGLSGSNHLNPSQRVAAKTINLKPKDLIGLPWRVAFALQADGWYLRSDIIWSKPNPMPESVTDRPTRAHEYLFLLTRSARYFYDNSNSGTHRPDREDIRYSGSRNLRSVWTIPTQPFSEAHFATFPEKLVEPCISAGCPAGGVVLDPFCGSGTVGVVAARLGRGFVGIELKPEYCEMARKRIEGDAPLFNHVEAR